MNELPPNNEAVLEVIDRQIEEILSRRITEVREGEELGPTIAEVLEEKEGWVNSETLAERLRLWNNVEDINLIRDRMTRNLASCEVIVLSDEDNRLLDGLCVDYYCTHHPEQAKDEIDTASFECKLVNDDPTNSPVIRGKVIFSKSSAGFQFKEKVRHEIGHVVAQGLFANLLIKKEELPRPHGTTGVNCTDPEGYLEYISSPDEMDVRVRACMFFLADSWNPEERPATMEDVKKIRDAGMWSISSDVRALRDHFTDDQILWMLNSMPAI